jgi:hypothetical protein
MPSWEWSGLAESMLEMQRQYEGRMWLFPCSVEVHRCGACCDATSTGGLPAVASALALLCEAHRMRGGASSVVACCPCPHLISNSCCVQRAQLVNKVVA